jgi:hypothetical protein
MITRLDFWPSGSTIGYVVGGRSCRQRQRGDRLGEFQGGQKSLRGAAPLLESWSETAGLPKPWQGRQGKQSPHAPCMAAIVAMASIAMASVVTRNTRTMPIGARMKILWVTTTRDLCDGCAIGTDFSDNGCARPGLPSASWKGNGSGRRPADDLDRCPRRPRGMLCAVRGRRRGQGV